ncbi:hypothetical protein MBLNU230_g4278t1 [Neophaeotheca triangularis]
MPTNQTIPGKEPISEDIELHTPIEQDQDHSTDTQAQAGVQNIQAITTVWSKRALLSAYILIWLIYFVEGMLAQTQGALLPFVTSSFASHSLTPTVSIVSSVMSGCANFTIAKLLDVFGRQHGFLMCTILATIGLVMMAACQQVEAYAAAQVFSTIGNNGLQYTISVIIADSTSLRNRGLVQAIASSPNIITCWLAGPISTGFLNGPGWPWAFGMFSILVPVFAAPLYGLLQWHFRKAVKQDLVPKRERSRTFWQSTVYHAREFDALGLILLSAGVALFLLPFNLYSLQATGWNSPMMICFLVSGVALLIIFILWERFLASVTFIPYTMLTDRTVLGACLLSAVIFFSNACWAAFFSSFLQVVQNLSITESSYLLQITTVGTVLLSLATGALIHYTSHFKKLTLYIALPLSILGTGLMIHFRHPHQSIGYLILAQLFIAASSGIIVTTTLIAVCSAIAHQHIAVAIALVSFSGSLGSAIGLTVASAIWQTSFPTALATYLPVEEAENFVMIYADLATQLAYPVGSAGRRAVQLAYGVAQRDLLIAATVVWGVGVVAVVLWRDVDVRGVRQGKGMVF